MLTGARALALVSALAIGWIAPAAASGAQTQRDVRVTMDDGVSLAATISGQAPLTARPVIVEFSPYGPGSGSAYAGTAYNYLLVQDRGTGASDGEFDALGPPRRNRLSPFLPLYHGSSLRPLVTRPHHTTPPRSTP